MLTLASVRSLRAQSIDAVITAALMTSAQEAWQQGGELGEQVLRWALQVESVADDLDARLADYVWWERSGRRRR
jgi:hypothetical protein